MDQTSTPEIDTTADDALKRRLLNRIAVAAVMVVGLLGSLAMFDAMFAPSQPVATKVAALPPKAPPAAPAEPSKDEPPPEARPADTKAEPAVIARAEEKVVPERTSSPGAPLLQPLPAEKPLTKPATGRVASMRPSEPVPPAAAPAARPDPVRELTQGPAPPRRAPASRPITQVAERQFGLQMGVFSNVANAEDLRAKLEMHGIPASIEARVHVGPFATREEADAARVRLKELGLDGGLLVTMKTKFQ